MKLFRFWFILFPLIALCALSGYAQEVPPTLSASGFVALREGQVVAGEPDFLQPAANSDHVWVQELYAGMNVHALFNPYPVIGNIGLECRVFNDYPEYPADWGKSRRLNFYPYLSRADIVYSFGGRENPSMTLDVGYFPFKYNEDARNLGEYLFRSGTYPQYLITDFDFPMARLLGARLSGKCGNVLKWDVLATMNWEWTAIGDLNLSAIASYKPVPLVEFGLGGSWCSIVSVNMDNTTPMVNGNDYVYNGKLYYYTFAGQKVMGRFSIDLQTLFPNNLFGKQDLKLYAEAAILGVVNYPRNTAPAGDLDLNLDGKIGYDDITKRIPVMFGFNWPTNPLMSYTLVPGVAMYAHTNKFDFPTISTGLFGGIATGVGSWLLEKYLDKKIGLDVLSIEAEWFGSVYPNDLSPIMFDNIPVPLSSAHDTRSSYNPDNYKGDDWKWSVYGKKTIADHFSVTLQFARDHMRWVRMDYTQQDGQEALRQNKDWYYTFKLGYAF